MKYNCALHVATKEVDGEVIELCYGTTIGRRGICSKCYKTLVNKELIKQGDTFKDFPLWLQDLIRYQDKEDHAQVRHPVEEYSEETLDSGNTATRLNLGNGGFKLRKMSTSTDIGFANA